jgi:prepilin-type processing-associated H-X9-DG protein
VFGLNRAARFKDISDGTSHTMILSEYLTAPADSDRGELWVDASPGLSTIYLHDTPNSSNPDQLYGTTCPADGNLPNLNLPCSSSVQDNNNMWNAARSYHPGGVGALFCDGSVHFITQEIDLTTWQNLGFIADGSVIEPNSVNGL